MNKLSAIIIGVILLIIIVIGAAVHLIRTPELKDSLAAAEGGLIPAEKLIRVPVTGVFPGATTAGLNPNMQNPLANDPDAAQRGMKDFDKFNCSGCHMARGGGGMGPALSDNIWNNRESAGNIYLDIAQGRGAGMPAWGGTLPDRTIWELVAYIQSISSKPAPTFGSTTSVQPPSPDKEQVPAEQLDTTTPWNFTEPMPPDGEKPGHK